MSNVLGGLGSIFGGGSSSSSSASSNPVNLQNQSYTNLTPAVGSNLAGLFQGGPNYSGVGSALGSSLYFPATGYSDTNNPLVAPLTQGQNNLVAQGTAQGAPTAQMGQAGSLLSNILNPSFLNPQSNPALAGAVSGAVNPLIQAFNQTTVPALQGQFTQGGQRTGPMGSSAFDRAAGNAQTGLEQSIGNVTGNLELGAYNTNLGAQLNAVGQAGTLSQTELANTINSLQVAALPQMIQQYGINQGLQVFQQRMNTMLQALGLGGQISQPAIGNQYASQSQSSGASQGSGILSGIGNVASGSGLGTGGGIGGWLGTLFGGSGGAAAGAAGIGEAGAAAGGVSEVAELAPLLAALA